MVSFSALYGKLCSTYCIRTTFLKSKHFYFVITVSVYHVIHIRLKNLFFFWWMVEELFAFHMDCYNFYKGSVNGSNFWLFMYNFLVFCFIFLFFYFFYFLFFIFFYSFLHFFYIIFIILCHFFNVRQLCREKNIKIL